MWGSVVHMRIVQKWGSVIHENCSNMGVSRSYENHSNTKQHGVQQNNKSKCFKILDLHKCMDVLYSAA